VIKYLWFFHVSVLLLDLLPQLCWQHFSKLALNILSVVNRCQEGWGSVIGIATCYRLDSSRFELR